MIQQIIQYNTSIYRVIPNVLIWKAFHSTFFSRTTKRMLWVIWELTAANRRYFSSRQSKSQSEDFFNKWYACERFCLFNHISKNYLFLGAEAFVNPKLVRATNPHQTGLFHQFCLPNHHQCLHGKSHLMLKCLETRIYGESKCVDFKM